MGFSVSAAAAIIGVSCLIALEIFGGTLLPASTALYYAHSDFKKRAIQEMQTDFSITSIATTANGTGHHDLNITLENTGSSVIRCQKSSIIINGTLHNFSYSTTYVYPLKSVNFSVYNLSYTGQVRVKIISNYGVSTYEEYSI